MTDMKPLPNLAKTGFTPTTSEQEIVLVALRAHLAEGEHQAHSGHFVEDFSMDELIRTLDEAGSERSL